MNNLTFEGIPRSNVSLLQLMGNRGLPQSRYLSGLLCVPNGPRIQIVLRPINPVSTISFTNIELLLTVRRVVELIEARIEDDLSLEEIAESVNLSTSHFSHMFRSSTGQSPYKFVLHRRVDRAKEMLRNSDFRVLDVAVACGFKTQQHFARVFRQLSGFSPREYRYEFIAKQKGARIVADCDGVAFR